MGAFESEDDDDGDDYDGNNDSDNGGGNDSDNDNNGDDDCNDSGSDTSEEGNFDSCEKENCCLFAYPIYVQISGSRNCKARYILLPPSSAEYCICPLAAVGSSASSPQLLSSLTAGNRHAEMSTAHQHWRV